MRRRVARALDDCLAALADGSASVDECLAAHPEHANELRPLLELSLNLKRAPQPKPADSAAAAARAAMLSAVAQRRRTGVPVSRGRMGGRVRRVAAVGLAALVLVVIGGLVAELAIPPNVARAATVLARGGLVEVQNSPGEDWQAVEMGMRVSVGDRIRTERDGFLTLGIGPGATVDVAGGSEVEIIDFRSRPSGRDKSFVLKEIAGSTVSNLSPVARGFARFEIVTPRARVRVGAGEGGARIRVQVRNMQTDVSVDTGHATVEEADSIAEVGPGESAQFGGTDIAATAQPIPEATRRSAEDLDLDEGSGTSIEPSAVADGDDGTGANDGPEGDSENEPGGEPEQRTGTPKAADPGGPEDETPRSTRTPEREVTPKATRPLGTPQGDAPETHEPTPSGPGSTSGGDGVGGDAGGAAGPGQGSSQDDD